MDPIVLFLREDILPEDKTKADKIRRNAPRFWLSEDQKLYKHFFSRPYLLCIHPEESKLFLKELHKGFMETIQEADLYLIEPLLRAIDGRICRKKYKNM